MFTFADIQKYSGIKILIGDTSFVYSMEFFMLCFVEFSQKKADDSPTIKSKFVPMPVGSYQLFAYSQSLRVGDKKPKDISWDDNFEGYCFPINGRFIDVPHDMNAYVFDNALVKKYPQDFNDRSVSYLKMAKKLTQQMMRLEILDEDLARHVVEMLLKGEIFDDDDFEVVSIIMGAIFLAEPKRNPSCFLPSLMLLDLMAHSYRNPLGIPYAWENSLQNTVLVLQEHLSMESLESLFTKYFRALPIPRLKELQLNNKNPIPVQERVLLNADKKYNGKENLNQIQPSEFFMRLGGYFPMSHLSSYAELDEKRKEKKLTLSDIKSFILISDWLSMRKVATSIHKKYLHLSDEIIDKCKTVLMEVIFPQLWDNIDLWILKEEIKFYYTPQTSYLFSPMKNFPSLLKKFNCTPQNITPHKVAHALFLIYGSKLHTQNYQITQKHIKKWCADNGREPLYNDAEKILQTVYNIQPFESEGRYCCIQNAGLKDRLSLELPHNFDVGKAYGLGDCFFDTIAQCLNARENTHTHNIITIRKSLYEHLKYNYIHSISYAIEKDAKKVGSNYENFQDYINKIKLCTQDTGENVIWGRTEIEGRVLCNIFNIRLHVIEVNPVTTPLFLHAIIDQTGSTPVQNFLPQDYEAPDMIHLVIHQNHTCPILKK